MTDTQTLRAEWQRVETGGEQPRVLNLIKDLDFYSLDKQGDNSMKVSTHLILQTAWKAKYYSSISHMRG